MKSKRRGFDVHINEEFAEEFAQEFAGGAGASIDEFAQSFAGWQASPTKEFDTKDIQKLLDAIDHNPAATFRIVGYNEFPYRAKIEREYWLKVGNVNQGVAGNGQMAILHVHYAGKWTQRQSLRDRSVVTQMNLRHSVPVRGNTRPDNTWYRKCVDLNKWREMRGKMVFHIPKGGWYWQNCPAFSTAMHTVLSAGERCRTIVRELGGAPQEGHAIAPRSVGRALIIAVSEYDSEKAPNLPNAVNDAIALRKALQVHALFVTPQSGALLTPNPEPQTLNPKP
ncbi:hypothetical protein T484DRAFT_3485350 [Baffinella frigidus]|nr:hypothetical protein T484DRAFT_3485350 [Cryptophyta sp. CCMP2293]